MNKWSDGGGRTHGLLVRGILPLNYITLVFARQIGYKVHRATTLDLRSLLETRIVNNVYVASQIYIKALNVLLSTAVKTSQARFDGHFRSCRRQKSRNTEQCWDHRKSRVGWTWRESNPRPNSFFSDTLRFLL